MRVSKTSGVAPPAEPIPVTQIESKVSRAFKLVQNGVLFEAVFLKLLEKKYTPIAPCREELCQLTDQTGKSLLVRALELDPPDQALITALVTDKIALGRAAPNGDMPLDLAARRGDLCAIGLLYPHQDHKVKESALEIAVASHQTQAVIKLLTMPTLIDKTPLWFSLINIGIRYSEEEFFTGALEIYAEALAVAEESFRDQKDEGNFVITWHNLGSSLAALNRFPEALVYYQKAYNLVKKIFERCDQRFLTLIYDLAKCHTALSDHKMARVFLREALDVLKRVYYGPHHQKICILNAIAVSYAHSGSMEQVDESAQCAFFQASELKEDSQIMIAEVLDNKGHCYFLNRQYQQALDFYQEALGMLLVFCENEHSLVIDCLMHLAECQTQLGNHEQAKMLMEDAREFEAQLSKKTEGN